MDTCNRCGNPFKPEWVPVLKQWNRCCSVCSVRNLMDGLGLPTPPELLDAHTKKPTLTNEEYHRKMERKKRTKPKK